MVGDRRQRRREPDTGGEAEVERPDDQRDHRVDLDLDDEQDNDGDGDGGVQHGSIDVSPIVIGLAIASGAMFALQVNSNSFWMYKSLLGLSTRGTFKTLTMVTSVASVVSLPMVMAVALIAQGGPTAGCVQAATAVSQDVGRRRPRLDQPAPPVDGRGTGSAAGTA
ncbi:GntP family permease [Geodermatophilus africanus]|uniref:GntP family permease n=1 Tax=Geodermatophilus africanus TaxID=1137993 RepID=A0A1H3QI72_9ACTN|nr:GntP family permease [Geodermatophilus africanus]SDZ13106.1 GntP family permease [Geodermatophilus africanus]